MDEAPYTVGYKRPPLHSRFRPGQSGNPKGSRRRPKRIADHIAVELGRRITVTENGRPKRITWAELLARQYLLDAKGKNRHARDIVNAVDQRTGEVLAEVASRLLAPVDERTRDSIFARLRAAVAEDLAPTAGPTVGAADPAGTT